MRMAGGANLVHSPEPLLAMRLFPIHSKTVMAVVFWFRA